MTENREAACRSALEDAVQSLSIAADMMEGAAEAERTEEWDVELHTLLVDAWRRGREVLDAHA